MLPTGRRPTRSDRAKTWATVSTGRSAASSSPAPRMRHGFTGRILSSSVAVMSTARRRRYAFGRHRDRDAVAEEFRAPLPDHCSGELADRHPAEVRRDVLLKQPSVKVHRARAKIRALSDPGRGVVGELDLAAIRVGPLADAHLRVDQDERFLRVGRAAVCFLPCPHPAVRAGVTDLQSARRQLADIAETPCPSRLAITRLLSCWAAHRRSHWLNAACIDELSECRFTDADVASDFHELDPPFRDQAANEANRGTHAFGRC